MKTAEMSVLIAIGRINFLSLLSVWGFCSVREGGCGEEMFAAQCKVTGH